ncbi:MAG: NmrA family NAD(P)-binding protein [Gemmatimonadetes bacterium]|nr:NmrA family NAD(P)-binding protein [Gemmatimonadota bacterium]
MADRVLVTGATGKVGRELVRRLLGSGEVVRAGTRRPAVARESFGTSVESVEMDYDATETWDAALQWVDRLFLMPPPFEPDAYETIHPFLDWAVTGGVQKVVLLSAMDVENLPELPLHRLERHLMTLGVPHVVLRPNLFMQNFTDGFLLDGIRERGTIELSTGAGRVSFVDGKDVAAIAAAALQDSRHDGRAYTLTGSEALDMQDVAAILSESAGRTIAYEAIDDARLRDTLTTMRWPVRRIAVALGLFRSVRDGRRAAVHPDLEDVLGSPPTRFADFAAGHGSAWR